MNETSGVGMNNVNYNRRLLEMVLGHELASGRPIIAYAGPNDRLGTKIPRQVIPAKDWFQCEVRAAEYALTNIIQAVMEVASFVPRGSGF